MLEQPDLVGKPSRAVIMFDRFMPDFIAFVRSLIVDVIEDSFAHLAIAEEALWN